MTTEQTELAPITIEPVIRTRDPVGTGTLIFREPKHAPYPGDTNDIASRLFSVLSWKRPYDSDTEELFARHYLDGIEGMTTDQFGNRHCYRAYPDGSECKVMWSCHIDTCHHDEGFQRLVINKDNESGEQYVMTLKGEGNCLGADDGTGVWLLLELLKAGKPGYYLFHRGEEKGCIGSRWLKDKHEKLLSRFDAAIALDRRDFADVITHQSGERCCSQEFALALAGQLGGSYKPDDTGSVTDTKQYTEIIPECTNLSVGYQQQHGPLERQYVAFALSLRRSILAMDIKALPIKRDPKRREYKTYYGSGNYGHNSEYKNPLFVEDCYGNEPWQPIHPKEYWVRSSEEHRDILKANALFVKGRGWITKPTIVAPIVVPELPATANDRQRIADGEVLPDPDELSEDDALWLTMLDDWEKKMVVLVAKYPVAATRLLLKLHANTFDLLCEHHGEEQFSSAIAELDEEDAAEDVAAGIDPAEDTPAPTPSSVAINGRTHEAPLGTGYCSVCMRQEDYCICD